MPKYTKKMSRQKAKDLTKIVLSTYWKTVGVENWSITGYDTFMVKEKKDMTKSKCHNYLYKELSYICSQSYYTDSSQEKEVAASLLLDLKKANKLKQNTDFWKNHSTSLRNLQNQADTIKVRLENATLGLITQAVETSQERNAVESTGKPKSTSSSSQSSNPTSLITNDECAQIYKIAKMKYFVGNGFFSNKINNDAARWFYEGIDISGELVLLRKRSLRMAREKRILCPARLLSLNFIYLVSSSNPQVSIQPFLDAQVYDIIKKKYTNVYSLDLINSKVNNWCEDLVTVAKLEDEAYTMTLKFLFEAGKDAGLKVAANVLFHMVPRLQSWKAKRSAEDTFVKKYVGDMFECTFGTSKILGHEWANKSLIDTIRRDDCDFNLPPYKPDYISYVSVTSGMPLNLFCIEVKPPNNTDGSHDLEKLGFEMKSMLNVLIMVNIPSPVVLGLHVDAYDCTLYALSIDKEAQYIMFEIGYFHLVKSAEAFPLVKHGVEVILLAQSIVENMALKMKSKSMDEERDIRYVDQECIPHEYIRRSWYPKFN